MRAPKNRVIGGLVIERDVPMPGRVAGTGRELKYPALDEMVPGDSVMIQCDSAMGMNSIRSAVAYLRRTRDVEFVSRSVDGGVRVWRKA